MGYSPKARLYYGYPLTDGEGEWHIREYDEDERTLKVDWFDEDEHSIWGLPGLVEDHLTRRSDVFEEIGVSAETYGHHEYPAVLLAVSESEIGVEWSEFALLDFDELGAKVRLGRWDGRLAHAIELLGITPKQDGPRWMMVADYG